MKKNTFIILALILIDQIIKLIVVNTIGATGESIAFIPNILNFTYVENTGGAFGLFSGRLLLIGLDILIIYAVARLLLNKKYELDTKAKLGLSLIIAGGMGNLIDRIFRGYVIDYIDITELINIIVFNFADICIVSGVILVFIMILINTVKKQESPNEGV